jgi:hypothetical protein
MFNDFPKGRVKISTLTSWGLYLNSVLPVFKITDRSSSRRPVLGALLHRWGTVLEEVEHR